MAEREIYFVPELAAYFGAGDMSAAQSREGEAHAVIQCVCAAGEGLKLIFAEAVLVGNSSVEFGTEGEAGVEVVLKRKAAGVDVAARGLDSKDTGAGVAGE